MTIDPIFHPVVVALVALALLAFSWFTYVKGTPGRPILLALRLAAVAVIVWIMLRPSWITRLDDSLSTHLLFLVDQSRSMAIADEAANRSRWEAVIKDIDESTAARERLKDQVSLRWFAFGADAKEATTQQLPDQKPELPRSAIGDSLDSLLRQSASNRISGVVLMSDGANTAGISPLQVARRFKSAGIPIHAVGYGQEVVTQQSKDLIARTIRSNPTVFAKNKLTVTGEFDVSSVGSAPVQVRLLFNGVEQSKGEFRAGDGANRLLADLVGTPTIPGDLKVTLEASLPGDPQTSNNSVSTYVTVLSGGISVLEIEGKYRFWEPKYVRWALDQSADIALEQLFLLEQQGSGGLPKELLEPGRVDVFILGDIAAKQFTSEQLRTIVERVQSQGAGLMMMGGYDAFGPGGWSNSPLAEILPVVMRPADLQRTGALPMMPTDEGLRHYILRLAPDADANKQAWQNLSPLDGASSWSSLKAGAQLLASASDGTGLLAAQSVGAGRSIAFAGDTTWRWRKDKQRAMHHARFWRQLILWLAKKEDAGSPTLKVSLASRRVAAGQGLPIVVQPISQDGSPLRDVAIDTILTSQTGAKSTVTLYPQGTEYLGTIRDIAEPGDYTVEVTGKSSSADLGKTSVKFLAFAEDAEAQQTAADLGLLRSLAQTTGGQFVRHLELDKLLAAVADTPIERGYQKEELISLWDRWEVLTLFLILLAVEWTLRKRRGLV
jgi:hypothetical protein